MSDIAKLCSVERLQQFCLAVNRRALEENGDGPHTLADLSSQAAKEHLDKKRL